MSKDYFKVEICENDKPFAYYMLGINWIPDNIINDGEENGYIVQKVEFTNTTGIDINQEKKKNLKYYEAWKVENKKVIRDAYMEYDDLFLCGNKFCKGDCIKVSLGKIGIIKYSTQVYWISEKNNLYNTIEQWEENKVEMSNGLKSSYLKDCSELENYEPIFKREDFVHKVKFDTKNIIKQAVQETFEKRIKENDESLYQDLYEIFENTDYLDIIDEIVI